uniref:Uncharacterized protein n=1 Tax=Anguilla anguilla TaxID=7936 RepID=A0A0E9VZY6_ANGAN
MKNTKKTDFQTWKTMYCGQCY